MEEVAQIIYNSCEKNTEYENLIKMVLKKCFEKEKIEKLNLYISITLTSPEEIKKINNQFRKINKETDVLSFPMYEKAEIECFKKQGNEILQVLGDILISIPRVKQQAKEYEHSFERELSYMVVHGFYHIMGYDHIEESQKQEMREKEEAILNGLNIIR